jgi:hypothetical protein
MAQVHTVVLLLLLLLQAWCWHPCNPAQPHEAVGKADIDAWSAWTDACELPAQLVATRHTSRYCNKLRHPPAAQPRARVDGTPTRRSQYSMPCDAALCSLCSAVA